MSIRSCLCRSFGGSARGDPALLSSFAPAVALLALLLVGSSTPTTRAQEVAIPDPGLNAAIREALQKPGGPLTEQDLLTMTELNADSRNIRTLQGLEAARNLTVLGLRSNLLANL